MELCGWDWSELVNREEAIPRICTAIKTAIPSWSLCGWIAVRVLESSGIVNMIWRPLKQCWTLSTQKIYREIRNIFSWDHGATDWNQRSKSTNILGYRRNGRRASTVEGLMSSSVSAGRGNCILGNVRTRRNCSFVIACFTWGCKKIVWFDELDEFESLHPWSWT